MLVFFFVSVDWRMLHAVEVARKSIHMRRTEAAGTERARHPTPEMVQVQPVETAQCVHRGFPRSRPLAAPQMLGGQSAGASKLTLDSPTDCWDETRGLISRGGFGSAMIRMRIPHSLYTLTGIIVSGIFAGTALMYRFQTHSFENQ